MQVNENKELEKLVDKMMRETALESPSFDFTSKVMSQVLATKSSRVTTYKPLISTTTFVTLFGLIFVFCAYLFMYGEGQKESLFTTIQYRNLFNNRLLSGFSISKITVYAVVVSIVMFYIQIPFLKNHFDNQMEN
jgi:hypothetical protein